MDPATPLVDFAPTARLLLLAAVIASVPLAWVWLRQRAGGQTRLAALTALALFLTFDLVVFGSFTRLTDSGLGCPDWPGCYGQVSPLGARADIAAAEAAMPGGPVTTSKAWIEMIHRYLAMAVGALIVVMTGYAWRERARLPFSPWWPTATLAWILVQGLFGKYTVTLKLYPAIVTLHLLGGLVLLVLLALQHVQFQRRPIDLPPAAARAGRLAAWALGVQIALGGWVSTNYAVLACRGFPQCNGQWWPPMDVGAGFTLLRHLGQTAQGEWLPLEALVAIHMAHRLFAIVATLALALFAWRAWGAREAVLRRFGGVVAVLLVLQLATGLSNIVLEWPIVAALLHAAGAAALVVALALLLARGALASMPMRAPALPARAS